MNRHGPARNSCAQEQNVRAAGYRAPSSRRPGSSVMICGVPVPGMVGPVAAPVSEIELRGLAPMPLPGLPPVAVLPVNGPDVDGRALVPVVGSVNGALGITVPGGVAVKTLPGCVLVLPVGPMGPALPAAPLDVTVLPAASVGAPMMPPLAAPVPGAAPPLPPVWANANAAPDSRNAVASAMLTGLTDMTFSFSNRAGGLDQRARSSDGSGRVRAGPCFERTWVQSRANPQARTMAPNAAPSSAFACRALSSDHP